MRLPLLTLAGKVRTRYSLIMARSITVTDANMHDRELIMLDGETQEECERRYMTQDERDLVDAEKEVEALLKG